MADPVKDVELWLCIGGPLHGKHRPAGPYPIAGAYRRASGLVDRTELAADLVRSALPTVPVYVPEPPSVLYYPRSFRLPGWRVATKHWLPQSGALERGSILPGSIVGAPPIARVACRMCWGRPLDGVDYCAQPECIAGATALHVLDTMVTIGEGWGDAS
jgi:hypothetical protein